jgi:hypothetical protein
MPTNFLFAITPWPAISAIIWIVLLMAVLYLARHTAHQAIRTASGALSRGLRIAAHSVTHAQARLAERNREVLLAAGRESKERIVEREFMRVSETVRKDLSNYPHLHRALSESITQIEKDHQGAVDVPPDPPGWVKAVETVSKLDAKNGGNDVLSDIHKSVVKAHKEAMDAYRDASSERHELLRSMMPRWRDVQEILQAVDKKVEGLLARLGIIDRHMQEYEAIVKGEDKAVSVLSSSSLVQFFVSAMVLCVAIGGAAINFTLIARPMAEMVGGTSYLGTFKTADIAALVIIMVEISMGLFLMESLRITRLFPVISALPDKMRTRMIYITFTILLLLASVEAGLAYMREVLLQDELSTSAILRGAEPDATGNQFLWITTAAQMGMGFILPFALTFIAIPLETFIHSLRTVLGLIVIGILRGTSLILRVLSSGFRHLGTLAERIYDLPLFVPLWLESRMERRSSQPQAQEAVVSRPVPVVVREEDLREVAS